MSQDLREMLANRRFAIPLIVLLAFCFVGLILIGVVLILRPGAGAGEGTPAAVTPSAVAQVTAQPTITRFVTQSPTPRPTATMVPVGTAVISESGGTAVISGGGDATPTSTAGTPEATPQATTAPQATAAPAEGELADTGVGWGLILFSAVGLAMVAIAARRLRMAQ